MPGSNSTKESAPDQLSLVCQAGDITIEAGKTAGEQDALPKFSMVAYTGGAMTIEGWRHPVVVDLQGMAIASQRRPIRFAHSAHQGVGHTERIAVEEGRLVAEGVVSRDTAAAREIVVSGRRGFPWQASIGASVQESELIKAGRTINVNGRTFDGPLYVARRTTLGEISFVDLGADGNTSAAIAAAQDGSGGGGDTPPEGGTDAADPRNTAASGAGKDAGPAAPAPPPPANGDVQAARKQAADELRRQQAIRKVCDKHAEIAAKAIEEGWSIEKAELEVLRASRPKAPAAHVPDNTVNTQVLEAACLMTAKLAKVEDLFEAPTYDAAQKRFRGGIGLQELLLEAAWANGYSGRNFRDSRAVLRHAFRPDLEAGLSTIDVGGILSNVANKFLLEGFFSVERTWRNITAVRNVSDFKTVTSYRLVGRDQYELVAPGGELKHGTLGEESFTNRADTYGLMLSIDRRDIINDDLGAITTVPRKLGRGSGLKINDVFWTTFLKNAAFFTGANRNFLDGEESSLTIDGLTAAEVAFMDQVDPDGKPLGIMPAILLVPTALSAIGSQLFKSMELRDTTSDVKYPITNPHQGKFRPEVSRYLSNAQYQGHSSTAWYLLADPNDLPVIEVAFLNGQESPTIETAEADFNVLGIQMRGYHDFGVALQDPRGGTKSMGA